MKADEFKQRVEDVYKAITHDESSHGAYSWFARRARVRRQTVSAWVNGHNPIPGPALGLLECLERETRNG